VYRYYQADGYRQLVTFRKPQNMSASSLKKWVLDHSERVKHISGLRWYTLCFTFDTIDYSDGSPGRPLEYDAFEELYFVSLDELKRSYDSTIMQEELWKMKESGIGFRGVWAEAFVIKMKGLSSPPEKNGCARLFGGCKRAEGMTKKDLKDWYYAHAERVLDSEGRMIIPEIIGYIHNFCLEDSPFGVPFVDAYCNNWWNTKEEMFQSFDGEVWKGQLKDREVHVDTHDPSLFIGSLGIEYVVDLPQ
jgi:hypothetical protein